MWADCRWTEVLDAHWLVLVSVQHFPLRTHLLLPVELVVLVLKASLPILELFVDLFLGSDNLMV